MSIIDKHKIQAVLEKDIHDILNCLLVNLCIIYYDIIVRKGQKRCSFSVRKSAAEDQYKGGLQ